jgi:hypothetical protein
MKGRSEKGFVLFGVLVAIFVVAGFVLAYSTMEYARAARTLREGEGNRAFLLAEGGLDHAGALLSVGAWPAGTSLDWSADGLDNDGDALVDEGDEGVTVAADLWGLDGLDNDSDGAIDEPDEQIARVRSQARVGRVAESVTGWFRQTTTPLPIPPAAIYIDDPRASLRFNGNSFRVDGNDTNLDGSPGSADPLLGIAVNGDPTEVADQLSQQQEDNVTGLGGDPSVGTWSPEDPDFITTMVEYFSNSASNVFQNYSDIFTGQLGDASQGRFEVTYSEGDLRIGGGSQGAGVLCVEGNLIVSGGWDFVGYVFVTGRIIFVGGGGDTRIMGALFVGGDILEPSGSGGPGGTISGNIEILYSDEALRRTRGALSGFRLVAVSEP